MITRCLFFLNVLTGLGGHQGWDHPERLDEVRSKAAHNTFAHQDVEREHWPLEFPLAHFEMSFLLPAHPQGQRQEHRRVLTRVYNPVWTNPDGTAWVEMLEDDRIGLHVALTPVWSETAQWADYVLPTGLGPERHDLHSLETHASQWIGWRQPVIRALKEKLGHDVTDTRDANPGDVWEENEFWDRAVVADRPGRLDGHPAALRVPVPARREDRRQRLLPIHLRERRSRSAGEGGRGGPDAVRVHAEVRRVRGDDRRVRRARVSGRREHPERPPHHRRGHRPHLVRAARRDANNRLIRGRSATRAGRSASASRWTGGG